MKLLWFIRIGRVDDIQYKLTLDDNLKNAMAVTIMMSIYLGDEMDGLLSMIIMEKLSGDIILLVYRLKNKRFLFFKTW